jgi:AcrR family transcriptional regulator
MSMARITKTADRAHRKDAYHHGDLRQALVNATRQLVIERGAENFTLADACRIAGVSTAAPYKHFRDKDDILKELVIQGFDSLTNRTKQAVERHPRGSLEGIIAMGKAYVDFARSEPAIFRLMFGQNRRLKLAEPVNTSGRACFQSLIQFIAVYCEANGLRDNSARLAVELWTFAHGAASLLIDEDYDKVAPGLDVDSLIESVTPRLLGASGN